jgi:hypothetical protein
MHRNREHDLEAVIRSRASWYEMRGISRVCDRLLNLQGSECSRGYAHLCWPSAFMVLSPPECNCVVGGQEEYGSDYCSDTDDAKEAELQCDCKHAACAPD